MIKCNNCGLEFNLFTEAGYVMAFPDSESVRTMIKVCGQCGQDSSCLEWVDKTSKVALALVFADECKKTMKSLKEMNQ